MKTNDTIISMGNSIYLYTVPKAGTYLLSNALEELGFKNSGFHISFNGYLDTLGHTAETNRFFPSRTVVKQPFIKTFKSCYGMLSFGHLSPSFLPPGILKEFNIICSYRDPFEVLVSEFNDFRFIRRDVKFCSKETCANDITAFTIYLKTQVTVIRDIMIEMARYLDCFSDSLYAKKYLNYSPIIINFNRIK